MLGFNWRHVHCFLEEDQMKWAKCNSVGYSWQCIPLKQFPNYHASREYDLGSATKVYAKELAVQTLADLCLERRTSGGFGLTRTCLVSMCMQVRMDITHVCEIPVQVAGNEAASAKAQRSRETHVGKDRASKSVNSMAAAAACVIAAASRWGLAGDLVDISKPWPLSKSRPFYQRLRLTCPLDLLGHVSMREG